MQKDKESRTFNNIKEEKIDELIMNYLNTQKFQTSLNSLIISTLSHKKNMNLSRKAMSEKIICHEYIKEVENEILQNLFSVFNIENYNTHELINLKYRNMLQKEKKKDEPTTNTTNLVNSMIPSNTSHSSNINSNQLFMILTDEFLACEENLKIENYIGDLSNFDAELLLTNDKINDILLKVDKFLKNNCAVDQFLIPNMINFFSKITKVTNTNVLCKSITIFLDYFSGMVSKFYESSFDITKFYKLSFNVECLNRMIMKFYDSNDVYLRKAEDKTLKYIIDKIFETVMKNYNPNNPVYFSDSSSLEASKGNSEFGISTIYILLLFFLLDNNFSLFKVLFRLSSLRKHILPKFEDSMIKTLPFLDMVSCVSSLNKKFCFLWSHYSVLEKVFCNNKINKKFLLYCWISIKLNFLGLVLRYKSLRQKFYTVILQVDANLNCFTHFRNVFTFAIDLLFESKQDFEEYQRDNLFYLIKEILCDFILYCDQKDCCAKKHSLIEEIGEKEIFKSDKMLGYLINDLELALKDNFFTHSPNNNKE